MIRIATRASDLALWQANHVADRLRALGAEVSVESFSTRGDREAGALAALGGEGLFTAEVDRALLEGRADIAVHSLKDLPIEAPEGLALAAVPARGPVEDVLVSTGAEPLAELPPRGVVGTSSPRRAAFLHSARPDLTIVDLRGNVPTRLRKVASGEIAATVLARAGVERLGLDVKLAEVIGPPRLLPAPGQGALALVTRADDERATALALRLEDPDTRLAVDSERTVLAGLGGGCSLPLGVLARRDGKLWRVSAVLFLEGGAARLDDSRAGDDPLRLAADSARALRQMGAPA